MLSILSDIINELWILPRPRSDYYVGSFPLHFEKKLIRLLGMNEREIGHEDGPKVLHPFGGLSEFGDFVDLNPTTTPTWVGDAHDLHFIEDNTSYDLVLLNPPYSDGEAEWLYSTPPLKPSQFKAEAARVAKPGGYVAIYHRVQPTRPADGWELTHRVVVLTRPGHAPRVCFVYRKPSA